MKALLLVFLAAQSLATTALAVEGNLTVYRPLRILSSLRSSDRTDRDQLTLNRGTYRFEITFTTVPAPNPCIPGFCKAVDDLSVMIMSTLKKTSFGGDTSWIRSASVRFYDRSAFNGQYSYFSAAANGQSFTLIQKWGSETRSGPSHTETQECEVLDSCSDFRGCSYKMGTQSIRVHDEISTSTVKYQFVGGANETLAVFTGAGEPSVEKKIESKGKCVLNVR